MTELLGIIAPLRKFLSNADETIDVTVEGEQRSILKLAANRKYVIPDYQREIRWDSDNLAQLIDDIESGPKFLGNIILTHRRVNSTFLIIDGQQRITILMMILACIKQKHDGEIPILSPCSLTVNSFSGFKYLLDEYFPNRKEIQPEQLIQIIKSDDLCQMDNYYTLWEKMVNRSTFTNRVNAASFLDNLAASKINIMINQSDDDREGIRYFIDVNLKAKQLDTEDIFKAYLFHKDSSDEIRKAWYDFKKSAEKILLCPIKYPLLKLLEHFIYCDLYSDTKYRGLEFGEDFLLRKEFTPNEENASTFRTRTHIIEAINSNRYMLSMLQRLTKTIEVLICITESDTPSNEFKNIFNPNRDVDNEELKLMHNFLGKILKDTNNLPKALVMKFINAIILSDKQATKNDCRKIYGIYLLSILFMLFQTRKGIESFSGVLSANNQDWYQQLIRHIIDFFDPRNITDTKLVAQNKLLADPEQIDYQYRCKTLATIYNFFKIQDNQVVLTKPLDEIVEYISNSQKFSTEHLIISDASNRKIIATNGDHTVDYTVEPILHNKFVKCLFNFIFIDSELNQELKNLWLPEKLEILARRAIICDYSKMVIELLQPFKDSMNNAIKVINFDRDMDYYMHRTFLDQYFTYARSVIKNVLDKIKGFG